MTSVEEEDRPATREDDRKESSGEMERVNDERAPPEQVCVSNFGSCGSMVAHSFVSKLSDSQLLQLARDFLEFLDSQPE